MSERRSFLVRIDPAILDAVHRWADDELRSLNGQIEFILRRALIESGRMRDAKDPSARARSTDQRDGKKGKA